jgi:arsenate reductase
MSSSGDKQQEKPPGLTNSSAAARVAGTSNRDPIKAIMNITIYHNPGCGKSRRTLELIESQGITPKIVHYLETAPDAATLQGLAELLGMPLPDILRKGEKDFVSASESLTLDDDEKLAAWVHEHPRVLERPIVVNEDTKRAVIGRPPENVLGILTP